MCRVGTGGVTANGGICMMQTEDFCAWGCPRRARMLSKDAGCGLSVWVAAAESKSWNLMPSPKTIIGAYVGPIAGAAAGDANSHVLKAF